MIQYFRENPTKTATDAINETSFPASRSTACRRIKRCDWGTIVLLKNRFLLLTIRNKVLDLR